MEEIIINNRTFIKFNCENKNCNKEMIREKCFYNSQRKKSKSGKSYCSQVCAKTGVKLSEEAKRIISEKQKGISVMSRGRPGKVLSEEIKEKIRQTKLGVPSPKDWEGMRKELNMYEGLIDIKVIPLIKPVPDGILIQNGQVIAVEIEKEPYEYGIRTKMKYYDNIKYFDKVIIIWYRDNERIGEYHKINGVWSGLISTPAG